ncbi:MAG: hypothetical protein JKY94_17530 [Rhodobacteraceae bacterium]|nr:hypothetical protein [Paracoccaceae bacterium]
MSTKYVAKVAITVPKRPDIAPGTIVEVSDEILQVLIKKGAVVSIESPEALDVAVRGAGSLNKKGAEARHKFDYSEEEMDELSLDELNVLVLEKSPEEDPFETEKEARAFLSQDAK